MNGCHATYTDASQKPASLQQRLLNEKKGVKAGHIGD